MKKVIIYTTSWCPFCEAVKEYFNQKGISYEEKNVELNLQARDEMVEKSGQLGVPVIDIEGKIIIGYSPEEIDNALEDK
ncbi:MAG: glutathione S-transferase N-terminal domain-containing protein [Patescibacteria group bacterium]|nr:glutathione S-transferase N-terminal domain-containing protein [Patescibacteria group bacterium]